MRSNFEESEVRNIDPLFISFHGMKMYPSRVRAKVLNQKKIVKIQL